MKRAEFLEELENTEYELQHGGWIGNMRVGDMTMQEAGEVISAISRPEKPI